MSIDQAAARASSVPVVVVPAAPSGSPAPGAGDKPRNTRTRNADRLDAVISRARWRLGPVAGTANAGGAALNAAVWGSALGVTPMLAVAGGVAGGIGAVVAGVAEDLPGARLVWRASCWAAAGSWTAWAMAAGPTSPTVLGMLLAGVVGMGGGAIAAHRRRKKNTADALPAAVAMTLEERGDALAIEWVRRIKRVAEIDVQIPYVDLWDAGGFTLHVVLPAGGVLFEDLARHATRLAGDANLDTGCEVTPRRGRKRRLVFLDVTTVGDALEQTHHLTDLSPLSINDDLPIGVLRNGQPATVNLRFHCLAMAGQVDSGKSNQLNATQTQLARCVDTIIWNIDLTGGNLSRNWVKPWYQKDGADHPVIDWVAATDRQAEHMLDAALAIIDGRRSAYHQLMADANEDKIPVSPEIPEIVVVIDEIHRLPRHLRKKLVDVSDTGRGAGVRVVACGLRAVDSYLPGDILAQARVRVGMRVTDDRELAYLFGWKDKVDPNSAPYPGCGFLYQGEAGNESLVPFRGYRVDPNRIGDAAKQVSRWRPALDDVSQQLADNATRGAYTRRWADTLPVLFTSPDNEAETNMADNDQGPPAGPAPDRDKDDLIERAFAPIEGDTPEAAAERRKGLMAKINAEADAKAAKNELRKRDQAADTAAFELLMAGISLPDRLLSLIDDAGPDGIATGDLERLAAENDIGSRATVHRYLGQLADQNLIRRPKGRVIAARFDTTT